MESTENENDIIKIYLKSSERNGECPYCKSISHQVNSTYIRTLTDLPVLGNQVSLYLKARKFFCKNITCSKKTFAEQPGNEIHRYKRRTNRCELTICNLGVRMSAISTSIVLKIMRIPVSSSTALRTIFKIPLPDVVKITDLGVDDWAFRKGLVYGTILVDLEKGTVIDL